MIRLENVTRRYADGAKPALDDVSLTFEQGEFVFVTGPSGAGKSTLLKLLYAAERPDSGDVFIEEKSVVRLHPNSIPFLRRNLGVIFQDFKLLQRRSLFDNVALALEVCGQPRNVIEHKVLKILKRVGLEGLERRLPGALSAGEQQRAAIARALVNEPSIVLADEPTGNLDEALSNEIIDLLAELARERKSTVIVATHDKLQVALRGFRHVRVDAGRVVSDTAQIGQADDIEEIAHEPEDDWSLEPAVVTGQQPAVTVRRKRSVTQPSAAGLKAVTQEDIERAIAASSGTPTDEHGEPVGERTDEHASVAEDNPEELPEAEMPEEGLAAPPPSETAAQDLPDVAPPVPAPTAPSGEDTDRREPGSDVLAKDAESMEPETSEPAAEPEPEPEPEPVKAKPKPKPRKKRTTKKKPKADPS